jgi:hypothetical protein
MEIISPPTLYRAHSKKYLTDRSGRFMNPNISRERRPRDLPIQIHTSVRDWFIEKFGIDYRGKSLFCSGDISVARGYKTDRNEIVSLYPEGEFSLCFSPLCKDLFGFYQFNWMDPEASVEKIREDLGALAFIQASNSGLAEAAESGNEVMIFGSSFIYRLAA